MLGTFRWTALVAAIVLIISIAGAVVSSQPSLEPRQEQPTEANHAEQKNEKEAKTLWDRWFPDPISFFTLWLVVFTAVLAFVSIVQLNFLNRAERIAADSAKAAKDSADAAKQTLLTTQRPFVFLKSFEVHIVGGDLQIFAQWENSGVTPAVKKRNYASWRTFANEPPPDFTWPDLDKDGTPIGGQGEGILTFIGPKAQHSAEPLRIPITIIERIAKRELRLFVWGWTEYNDILGTAERYRTEFCNELAVAHMEVDDAGKVTVTATFPQYGPHNTAN
jgi:hypothetical protein